MNGKGRTHEQSARLFLWYMLGGAMLSTTSDWAYWAQLNMVKNLSRVSRYNWGTFAYSHLITGLRAAVRDKSADMMQQVHSRHLYGLVRTLTVRPL